MADSRNGGQLTLTGGQLIVRSLLAHGADLAFCVPGESYLPCWTRSTTSATGCASSCAARKAAPPTWPRPTAS